MLTVLAGNKFDLTIERLCHQLIENHGDFAHTCLVGVQPRGPWFANVLLRRLRTLLPDTAFQYGVLDVTFYRDDYRRRAEPLSPHPTKMNFLVEDKKVVLIDDVLFTGRTIRSALSALQHFGRPAEVELLVLVDRRFNRHLPIQADYVGITIDAVDEAHIKVQWEEATGQPNEVVLFPVKN